jgi:hypothetical protein
LPPAAAALTETAIPTGSEPCVGTCEGAGEASAGEHIEQHYVTSSLVWLITTVQLSVELAWASYPARSGAGRGFPSPPKPQSEETYEGRTKEQPCRGFGDVCA